MANGLKPLSAQKALDILTTHLLGEGYYIVDPVNNLQGNAIIVDDIIGMYKGVTESPVNAWRRKHKRCEFCQYCRYEFLPDSYGGVDAGWMCRAKMKPITMRNTPRPFCRVFKLNPFKEEIKRYPKEDEE